MCNMSLPENLAHLVLTCPHLDGTRQYALLLWANRPVRTVYNLFSSALKTWPDAKLINLILDPLSEISDSTLMAHDNNLLECCINFAQDYLYSIDKQRCCFYGEKNGA